MYATLVWTAQEAYDAFVAPLTTARRARYVAETTPFAALFGVPPELHPRSWAEFERYVVAMDEDGVLEVGPPAQAMAREVLAAGAADLVRPLGAGAAARAYVVAAGFLPPRLRAGYGLRWERPQRSAFAVAGIATRAALRALPARLRYWPHYLSARKQVTARASA